MKKTSIILLFIFLVIVVCGQSKWETKAEGAQQANDFTTAIRFFKKASEETTDIVKKKELSFRIGNCYRLMNLYGDALPWYEEAMSQSKGSPELYLMYADVLAKTGQTNKALIVLDKGLNLYPSYTELIDRKQALSAYKKQSNSGSRKEIWKESLINTKYSEYAPAWFNKQLIFSSTRISHPNEKIDGRTSHGYSDLYISTYDETHKRWAHPRKLPGLINSKYNDGTFTYDQTTSTGFTMQCNENASNCIIVTSNYNETLNTWGRPRGFSLNDKSYSLGHPCVNSDGSSLYFVSDMEGGYGGKDIWKVNKKNDGSWGLPINLGNQVNTIGDEMFPFLLGDTLLFFASNHHYGFGGMDLFYCHKKDMEYSSPKNLGYPFNSAADDFAMIILPDLSGGLFCSNRDPASSDDIFRFDGLPIFVSVEGIITDLSNGFPLTNAQVFFENNQGIDSVKTNDEGRYAYFRINPFSPYKVKSQKEHYYPELRTLSTTETDQEFLSSENLYMNFELTRKMYPITIEGKVINRENKKPVPGVKVSIQGPNQFNSFTTTLANGNYGFYDLKPNSSYTVRVDHQGYFSESRPCKIPQVNKASVFSKLTGVDMDFELTLIEKEKEIVLNNIYYDFDKSTLRPESKGALNILSSMLKETPQVVIQISSHTDARGTVGYNDKLSEERARSVVEYLISCGISPSRLISKGYGERNLLIALAETEEEHQENRRTTFRVLEVKDKKTIQSNDPVFNPTTGLSFRVQLLSTRQPIPGHQMFNAILRSIPGTRVFVQQENQMFKYEIGERQSLEEAITLKKQIIDLGYSDCFINAYEQGNKISINKAKELIKENR